MYRVDKQVHHYNKTRKTIIIFLAVSIFGAAVYWLANLKVTPKQNIQGSPPVSKKYAPQQTAVMTVDKPQFTMQLPGTWTEKKYELTASAPKYGFSNVSNARYIELYIDNVPTQLAVNKAVVVTSTGNGITSDTVSENCSTFTGVVKDQLSGVSPAKWQGVSFNCDMANTSRAVVGTTSTEGVNTVTVVGPTTGSHKLFVVYADNNINPDYALYYSILRSIKFK